MCSRPTLLTSTLLFFGLSAFAQVGINTTTPAAQLEIQSSSQAAPANTDGIIIPKIDAFPATNPTASQQAMMVYLTTASGSNSPGFYYWDNTTTSWIPIGSGKSWNLTGNSATSPATHFIGTTDNQPLAFRTNNTEHLRLNANGNFGIATASPQAKLHVFNGASGLTPNIFSPAIIEGNGLTYLNVLSNAETGVVFGSGGSGTNGGIVYNSGIYTNGMNFRTGGNQNRMSISSTGQVSIGNALANARLQILASSQAAPANTDGIIIPKIDAFPATNPTAAQQAMMVYLTTTSGVNLPGFYYWDNTTSSWIGIVSSANSDADWFEEGTTKSPNAITDDIFHMGNIAIGKNTTNYPLDLANTVNDTSVNLSTNYTGASTATGIKNTLGGTGATLQLAVSNTVNNSGNGNHVGVQNNLNGPGSGTHYAIINNISGAGTGLQYGESININNTGDGLHTGLSMILSGPGAGQHMGISSTLTGSGTGQQIAMSNVIANTADSNHLAIINSLSGNGNGARSGIANFFTGTGIGNASGYTNSFTKNGNGNVDAVRSTIVGSGTGTYTGVINVIDKSGNGLTYGVSNTLSGTSPGNKIGTYNYIDASAGGAHTGLYSEVLKPGSGNFAAYLLGNVSIGTTTVNNYLMPASRGTNDQIMQTDALGNVTWKDPNTALNSYAWGTLGNSGTNPATHFIGTLDNADVSLRTNGTEVMRLATNGNVGINTSTPTADLEVNGFTKLGSTAPAIKTVKLTGTTAAAQGGTTLIAHGVSSAKILGVTVLVEYLANAFVPNSYNVSAGYEYDYLITSTSVAVTVKTANSANILLKPIRVLLTYEQ